MSSRVRGFYVNATAWDFNDDPAPHTARMRETLAAEFDRCLDRERAKAWEVGYYAAIDAAPADRRHGVWEPVNNPYRGADQ